MSKCTCKNAGGKHKPHKVSVNNDCDALEQHVPANRQYHYVCEKCGCLLSPPELPISNKYVAWCISIAACLFAAVVLCMDWREINTYVDRQRTALIASFISFAASCVMIALTDALISLGGKWEAAGNQTGECAKPYAIISQKQIFSVYASEYRRKLAKAIRGIVFSFFSFLLSGEYIIIPCGIMTLFTIIYCIRSSKPQKWKMLAFPVLFILSAILFLITPETFSVPVSLLPGILGSMLLSVTMIREHMD